MEKIVQICAELMQDQNIIDGDQREVMIYGLDLLFSKNVCK